MNPNSTPHSSDFRSYREWLPGLVIVVCGGFALLIAAYYWGSSGYILVLGVPITIGFAIGWGLNLNWKWISQASILVVFGLLVGIMCAGMAGLVCGLIFLFIAIVPTLCGAAFGHLLRLRRRHRGSKSANHKVTSGLLLITAGLLYAESMLPPTAELEVVSTSRVLEVTTHGAWERLAFYEEIPMEPPLLARLGLPHPLYTEGRVNGVGDIKRCVYSKGHLRKRISGYEPRQLLAFDIIEQVGIEDRSIELISGRFLFESLPGGRTRVTLSTTYRPLLAARPFWQPFERALAHVLHQHVLDGMARGVGPQRTVLLADATSP